MSTWQLTPAINIEWIQGTLLSQGVLSINLCGLLFGSVLYRAVKNKLLRERGALRSCSAMLLNIAVAEQQHRALQG